MKRLNVYGEEFIQKVRINPILLTGGNEMKRLIGYVITNGAFSPCGKHYSNTVSGYNTIWKIIEKSEENYSYEALRINVRGSEIPKTLYGKKVYSSEEWYLEQQKY